MPSFFKKLRGKKDKSQSSPRPKSKAKNAVRENISISLPLVNTGTQAEFSPRILKRDQSLLSYGSAEDAEGYSTVRDAIDVQVHKERRSNKTESVDRHTPSTEEALSDDEVGKGYSVIHDEHRLSLNQSPASLRPLPPVPIDENDYPLGQKSKSESTLTSLTPEEYESESDTIPHSPRILTSPISPIYAKVKKDKTRPIDEKDGSRDHQSTDTGITSTACKKKSAIGTLGNKNENQLNTGGRKSVKIPSEVMLESFDSEESSAGESLLLPGQGGDIVESPPVLLTVPSHRPPPSPSPKNKTVQSSNSKAAKTQRKHTSLTDPSSSSKHLSQSFSIPNLSDLPVYKPGNGQSFTDGGCILSRTHPDGRVEYLMATPVFSPAATNQSPISRQQSYLMQNPINSSTPISSKPLVPPQPHVSILSQSHVSVPSLQLQVPSQTNDSTQDQFSSSTSTEQAHQLQTTAPQVPIPMKPIPVQPQFFSPISAQNTNPSLVSSGDPFHQQRLTNLNKPLSYSQPSLAKPYVGGLTEIDQLLSDHQNRTRQSSVLEVPRQDLPELMLEDINSKMKSSPMGDSKEPEIKIEDGSEHASFSKDHGDNVALQLTFSPKQNLESNDVTAEKLITETPLKLKRVLDKLLTESADKDKKIEKLQVSYTTLKKKHTELVAKKTHLNHTHEEVLKSTTSEIRLLKRNLSQLTTDNEALKNKLEAVTKKSKKDKKDCEKRIERLKHELRNLQAEVVHFQTNVQSMGDQYTDLQGMLSAQHDVNHTHIRLDEHKQAMAQLERLMQQLVQKSSSTSIQQNVEVTRLKQENQKLALQLTEMKGSLSVLNEECRILKRQKIDYEKAIALLHKDLKYSQAREMQALKCLNETLKEKETDSSEHMANSVEEASLRAARREIELQDMLRKMNEYKTKGESRKFQKHYSNHHRSSITELQADVLKKEQLLEEISHSKRLAKKHDSFQKMHK